MSSISDLAADYGMEPYAVAIALDTDYREHDWLPPAVEDHFRNVLDLMREQVLDCE